MNSILDLSLDRKTQEKIMIINLIRRNEGISRKELAAKLKLTKSAMTKLTNEMAEENLLVEEEEAPNGQQKRGRRKVKLFIDPHSRLAFGATVTKGTISVGLSNLRGDSLERRSVQIADMSYRDVLSVIAREVESMLKENYLPQKNVLGIGVAVEDRAMDMIEGASGKEKLAKLKRELSYGISLPVVTARAASGALLIQRLFAEEKTDNAILLNCDGITTEIGMLFGGRIYGGANECLNFACKTVDPIRLLTDYSRLFSPEMIYLCGIGFSEDTAAQSQIKAKYFPLEGRDLHLCGCAIAVEKLFYIDSSI